MLGQFMAFEDRFGHGRTGDATLDHAMSGQAI